jgi:hypothetical protein
LKQISSESCGLNDLDNHPIFLMASASFFWSPAQAFPGDQESTLLLGGKYALGRSMLIYWSEDINKLVRPLSVCKKISYFNDGKEKNIPYFVVFP